jgi:hypothetical protein
LTKVNRCLAEGRRALRRRTAAIEAGEECERRAPLLGEAVGRCGVKQRRELRRHLGGCPRCRARLGSLRAAGRAPEVGRQAKARP